MSAARSQAVGFVPEDLGQIRTTMRGAPFQGDERNDLGALGGEPPEKLLTFSYGGLCARFLEREVPLPVEIEGQDRHGTALRCELRVGPARPQGGLKEGTPTTALHLNDRAYRNDGSDDFEVPLNELQRQLPDGTRLRTRTVCA
ncbi:DUF6304 family protein [Streptomyces galilaeus]